MNFVRVLRMAVRYRSVFAASVVSALAVAVLWGANVGTVYPFIEVGLFGQSPYKWIETRIEQTEKAIADESAKIERLDRQLAAASGEAKRPLQADKASVEKRLAAENWSLAAYRYARPYVLAYLPDNPFLTIALVIGLLLVGTVVKDLFLIANNVLVARWRNTRPSICASCSIAGRCAWTWRRSARTARPT